MLSMLCRWKKNHSTGALCHKVLMLLFTYCGLIIIMILMTTTPTVVCYVQSFRFLNNNLPITKTIMSSSRMKTMIMNAMITDTTTTLKPTSTINPFRQEGFGDIELPNFDDMFNKIKQVSPLAKSVIDGSNNNKGFSNTNDDNISKKSSKSGCGNSLPWKTVEAKTGNIVHEIQKVDMKPSPHQIDVPMIRFRSSMTGPCVGEYFGRYILDLEQRQKWDPQIESVEELHTIKDLDFANIIMGYGKYGDCIRMGIGHAVSKPAYGITSREQMFIYGLQEFDNGSCIIWGSELHEQYDYMMPGAVRHVRAKSHLFTATLVPTGDNTFDVEYLLQLEIGGNIPSWLTTSPIVSTVKVLFDIASNEFSKLEDNVIHEFHKAKRQVHEND